MTQSLSSYLTRDEAACVTDLLAALDWPDSRAAAVQDRASALVAAIRARRLPPGQLESFLQHYSLNTEEGLALMCLAEALLRIPDAATANDLIRDKVLAANWLEKAGSTKDWVVKAAGVGLVVTSQTLDSAFARIGQPFIRQAMARAMRIMGRQFVLGTDIAQALQNSARYIKAGYRVSYDMLGEGARTAIDAENYYKSYEQAIDYIAQRTAPDQPVRPGISVKLSALHPRYRYAQRDLCVPALAEKLLALSRKAAAHNLMLTVDAEEVERLEISLDIMSRVLLALKDDPACDAWEGFGLALQAYQKRAFPLIDRLVDMSEKAGRRLQVRLVKGAYWDSEIKRAQIDGLADFPLFTRKCNTDLSYLACARKMLAHPAAIYPMFATHNAQTAAAIIELAQEAGVAPGGYEFQRLHGMGEALHAILREDMKLPASIYAPVGPHHDLLAYLVRRLLENGANTSFVNRVLDPRLDIADVVRDPVAQARQSQTFRHTGVSMPLDLYKTEKPSGRINSKGLDLNDETSVATLLSALQAAPDFFEAAPLIGGKIYQDTIAEDIINPADLSQSVGKVWPGNKGLVDKAMRVASEAFPDWSRTPAAQRAAALERYADLLEENHAALMALCVREAGKTIPDALAELREAVDFCRYYANRGRVDFDETGTPLPGPTGETNALLLEGRGVFVCISPWNFPLAIFTGQIAAALMAGNTVVAKPAEQTPLIAMQAVQLMHRAGIPAGAVNVLPGDGRIGAALCLHPQVAGVAFTGSTEVAREINRTLAGKDGPIAVLIAETGGLNAMIVDSSALPEQVVDDAVLSAFGSAGQRCSALRVLCLQDDIADKVIRMLKGAMAELRLGDPGELSSDIGPVIDQEAHRMLSRHREALGGFAKEIFEAPLDAALAERGHFFAPCAYELPDLKGLEREVFGPVLHVVRYKKDALADLIADLNAKGYGLTLGIHTRIDEQRDFVAHAVRAGNVYVNRSMIGAVVGTQPFGGQGLSGTGPKAGGPHYLARFATERVITINTTAAGGNASLVSLEE